MREFQLALLSSFPSTFTVPHALAMSNLSLSPVQYDLLALFLGSVKLKRNFVDSSKCSVLLPSKFLQQWFEITASDLSSVLKKPTTKLNDVYFTVRGTSKPIKLFQSVVYKDGGLLLIASDELADLINSDKSSQSKPISINKFIELKQASPKRLYLNIHFSDYLEQGILIEDVIFSLGLDGKSTYKNTALFFCRIITPSLNEISLVDGQYKNITFSPNKDLGGRKYTSIKFSLGKPSRRASIPDKNEQLSFDSVLDEAGSESKTEEKPEVITTGNSKVSSTFYDAVKAITHHYNGYKKPTIEDIENIKRHLYQLIHERLILDATSFIDELESNILVADIGVSKKKIQPSKQRHEVTKAISEDDCVPYFKAFTQLSIHGKRLLLSIISKLNKSPDSRTVMIDFYSYIRTFSTDQARRDVRTGINDLLDSTIRLSKTSSANWAETFSENNRSIKIVICDAVFIFQKMLSQDMLDAFIKASVILRKPHPLSLFYMMMLESKIGRKFEVSEISEWLVLGDSYRRFVDFRRKVIELSCYEITAHTDYDASYVTHKEGHKKNSVSHISFYLDKK